MKKLLFLLCISLNTFGQININLGVGESRTIEGGDYNITLNKDANLYIKGYVTINNINNFHNSTITIDEDAVVHTQGSTNLNGNSNLLIFGKYMTSGMEIQNGLNAVSVQGKLQVFGDFQINDNSEVGVCGEVEVGNYTNWHSQARERAVNLCNCGVWKTFGLNANRKNVVTGTGSVYYQTGNINSVISYSSTVFINQSCETALPVNIVSFDVKYNEIGQKEYFLELSEDSDARVIQVMESEDGKTWKEVLKREVFMEDKKSTKYSGIIK